MTTSRPYRLAAVVSHPIQYQAPLLRQIAADPQIDLHVFYGCGTGAGRFHDPQFGIEVEWDTPLFDGYTYTFLRNAGRHNSLDRFSGVLNPEIVSRISPDRYDAVWLHGWAHATNWLAWASAAVRRIPVLIRGEANGLTEPTGGRRIAKKAILRTMFSRVAGFLTVGSRNAEFYRQYGVPEDRLFHMPYAVDNDFFMERARDLLPRKKELQIAAGIDPEKPVILFCGKFLAKKRPMDLLQAFRRLREGQASLVFVGEGPMRKDLEDFIAAHRLGNVHLLGFRNQSELPACYALADVFVLPSDFEPWGLVVNEAMCSSLPVIAADQVGAAADLVRDGINGFVHTCGDVEDLADKLVKVIGNPDRQRRMADASRQTIAGWGIREGVAGIRSALERVVAQRA